jgi:DNA-binding NarL/FixJ family response regulator
MLTDKLKQLASLKSRAAALEAQVATDLDKQLAALPAKFGFNNPNDFIAALRAATSGRRASKTGSQTRSNQTNAGRRRRATITDETRAKVKAFVESGKTGSEIAKALSISLPSVQNIKKALGLVQKRKK